MPTLPTGARSMVRGKCGEVQKKNCLARNARDCGLHCANADMNFSACEIFPPTEPLAREVLGRSFRRDSPVEDNLCPRPCRQFAHSTRRLSLAVLNPGGLEMRSIV